MSTIVLGALLLVLVTLFLVTFWSLSARLDRLTQANAVLLDLVATHIVLTEEERARLAIVSGAAVPATRKPMAGDT